MGKRKVFQLQELKINRFLTKMNDRTNGTKAQSKIDDVFYDIDLNNKINARPIFNWHPSSSHSNKGDIGLILTTIFVLS